MSQELNLQEVTDNFLHKIEAIHESTTFLMLMSFVETKRAREEYLDFLKKQGEIEDEDEDKTVFKLRMEFAKQAKKLEKKSERSRTILTLLPRNFLVSLVAEYDSYLGQLITELLTYKPEILNSGEKNISFTDLTKLGSIEAAREHIIAKEVETVLRKSHSEQFDWLSSTFGLKLKSGLNSWGRFIELTERRNLFVHCDGIVSAQYLKVCARNDVEVDKEISVGHALGASKDYIYWCRSHYREQCKTAKPPWSRRTACYSR